MGTFNQEAWAVDVEPVAPGPTLVDELGAQLTMTAMFGGMAPWVDQRFVIRKILGAGGFGMVCLAHDRIHGGDVALKLLLQGPSANVSMTTSLREATSLQRCDHPSIVRVLDARHGTLSIGSRHYAVTWVAMNLVVGQDFDKWIDAPPPKSAAQIVLAMLQIADALHHAHSRGVIHRDLKPSNILLEDSGRATLVDFGLALASDHESAAASGRDALGTRVTRTGETRGTPIYMAPEAAAGLPSAASDQYSLALVLREALTGMHPMLPHGAPSTAPHDGPAMASRIGDVVRRAMAGVAADRFASMAEFAGALATASGIGGDWRSRLGLAARDPAVRTPSSPLPQERQQPSAPRGARSRRATIVALTGIALGATGVGAYFVVKQKLQDTLMANREGADDDGRSPTTVNGALTCADLPAFAGEWSMSSTVEWAAFAEHYEFHVPYRLKLTPTTGCGMVADLSFDTSVPQKAPLPRRPQRHRAVANPEAVVADEGGLIVRFAANYGMDEISGKHKMPTSETSRDEHEIVELRLSMQRSPSGEGLPVVDGVVLRHDSVGGDVRKLRVHARRGAEAPPTPEAATSNPCWVACELECAGPGSIRDCRLGCAEDGVGSGPRCREPSEDFVLPTRLLRQRSALTKAEETGDSTGLQRSCHPPEDAPSEAACARTSNALSGEWTIYGLDGPKTTAKLTLDARRGSGTELVTGRLVRSGVVSNVYAEISRSGAWRVFPASLGTQGSLIAAFPPFLMVGGATASTRATAVGVTLDDVERKLRATRRAHVGHETLPASITQVPPAQPANSAAPASNDDRPRLQPRSTSQAPSTDTSTKPSLKPKRPPRE